MLRLALVLILSTGGLLAWTSFGMFGEDDRDAMWKNVEQAQQQGLPQTAIKELDAIVASATRDEAYDELIKAVALKLAVQAQIEGQDLAGAIERLTEQLPTLPASTHPVLKTILANWTWAYYQQNRWRFMDRTETAAPPGPDIRTWDLPRILEEVDRLMTEALAAREELQQTPIGRYDKLLIKGTAPDSYRPTLFDFLAFEAIEFYSLGEQGVRPQGAFDLPADSPVLGSVEEFLAWQLPQDDPSPTLQALRLLQELLTFHSRDDDPAARLDVDLARLAMGYNQAYGEDKSARYQAALRRFIDEHGDHPLMAMASAQLAEVLRAENEMVAAREVALAGAAAHRDSVGGGRCQVIVSEIELASASITTERVWNEPWPTIDVTYRNVDKVYFRLVPFDFDQWVVTGSYSPENLEWEKRLELIGRRPAREWSSDLPKTEDYRQRTESLPLPDDLPTGSFYLLASHDPQFGQANNQITFCEVWISQLAIVTRTGIDNGVMEVLVCQANSGEPVVGASVQAWTIEENRRQPVWRLQQTVPTDGSGIARLKADGGRPYVFAAQHGNQRLSTSGQHWVQNYDRVIQPFERTVFFTDRSIYRPGQTIQYKGVVMRVNQEDDRYEVLANQRLTVTLNDVNGEVIETREHQTNDYGSFSGSFTAPRDRVTGAMSIQVTSGPGGATSVRVEEYKRPKFFVEVKPPTTAPRLDDEVTVGGTATSYTSAPIDGAAVRWRVVREVRFPLWWSYRFWWWPTPSSNQEIAHGTTTTGVDGSFNISFAAVPDRTVPKASEPTFQYTVHADVTDTTGETRSSSVVVNVGYTALAATVEIEPWQVDDKPVEVKLTTATLDGEAQTAEGKLTIYRLGQPDRVHRPRVAGRWSPYIFLGLDRLRDGGALPDAPPDWSDINTWPNGEVAHEEGLATDDEGKKTAAIALPAGAYRAVFETQDRFGTPVRTEQVISVYDLDASRLTIKQADVLVAARSSLEPNEEFVAVWGTGYDSGRAFVEVEHRGRILKSYWTDDDATQNVIRVPVTEAMRGGFTVRVSRVRENRAFLHSLHVDVPWTNKKLAVKWEHFVSKLQPASQESWTAIITGPDAQQIAAEMVAAMYDASLDALLPHSWPDTFGVFRTDYTTVSSYFANEEKQLQYVSSEWHSLQLDTTWTYRSLPPEFKMAYGAEHYGMRGRALADRFAPAPGAAAGGMEADAAAPLMMARDDVAEFAGRTTGEAKLGQPSTASPPPPDLSQVSARRNLQETAFFFPHLIADESGVVRMEFTMPEALTEWKFLGFAHDRSLRTGLLSDKVVTAKDLMVQPNPPRFLREGDVLEFTVKISNQSDEPQTGSARLSVADAITTEPLDAAFGITTADQSFEIPAGQSRTLSWRLVVPDQPRMLTYKAVGATATLSDGEEGFLPVLTRRLLVTESMSMPIRGNQTRDFRFERLAESGQSDTLEPESLTIQVTSNPAWYAVLALPYLMEFPHECSEQVFNRFYANGLARHIAGRDPKIRRVFDQWRGTEAIDSPLEKNEDIKSVLIAETPWLREARQESQQRRDVGNLFDDNRLNDEQARTFRKLVEMQYADGMWPWFPGGRPNEFITLYIVTGFGRLRHLGVGVDVQPAVLALTELDRWIDERYRDILRHGKKEDNHLSPTICLYLYGRSFFLEDQPIAEPQREAVDYFLGQARKYWVDLGDRLPQGHAALALARFGDQETPRAIVASLVERSLSDDEMGMYWREGEQQWWWYRAPIETQALMIEVFDEIADDAHAVEECKIWLIKQKQTQNWRSTKATADAVYGLLVRGENLLDADGLVEISLGGDVMEPEAVEAGTGYYRHRFAAPEIRPEMATIRLANPNPGVAWGSAHWQYFEDIGKVTAHQGTPLEVRKALFVKTNTDRGPVLNAVSGPVSVGDELVVRIEVRVDRDMEFVHLKDYRASGSEPVDVLSQYQFQDGLAYYQSTRDTASHFFIDYLPRGTYVFEYSVRIQHKGAYETGIAEIECMYAPEFNSHSESIGLAVE